MKLSVKSDYAARAVLGLARHYSTGSALRVEDLASRQGVPANARAKADATDRARRFFAEQLGR